VVEDRSLFVSYAQGFSIPELGFAANSVRPGVAISGSEFVAPILVESFEGGVRGGRGAVRYTLSGFYAPVQQRRNGSGQLCHRHC
jgi:hypothetical protein